MAITAQQTLKERLGSDLKFPIEGNFLPIDGVALVIQDIQQLLLTMPGERVGRPEYGCLLRVMIWENLDIVATAGADAIKNAINKFEPRVTVSSVTPNINRNTGLIVFKIQFVIIAVDVPVNLVFPFRTGTQLSQA